MPRRVTQATFSALTLLVLRRMDRAFERYGAGKINLNRLHGQLHEVLANGHARAAYMGRFRAGDTSAFEDGDRLYGAHAADEEKQWLDPFVEDLRAGKYGEQNALDTAAIARRSKLYAHKLRGTANIAWAGTLDDDTDLYWTLDGQESEHCGDCPHYAENGPYKAHSRPTDPGNGETECLTECLCFWRTADGQTGFKAVRL